MGLGLHEADSASKQFEWRRAREKSPDKSREMERTRARPNAGFYHQHQVLARRLRASHAGTVPQLQVGDACLVCAHNVCRPWMHTLHVRPFPPDLSHELDVHAVKRLVEQRVASLHLQQALAPPRTATNPARARPEASSDMCPLT